MSRSEDATGDPRNVERAIDAFRRGQPVAIHDAADREGETDLVYPAGAVTPDAVARMRNDAGGLICVALDHDVATAFDLPFIQETLTHAAAADHDLSYDDRSSFSLTVNHRDTDTGITDRDRSLTIRTLASAATAPSAFPFAEKFRAPGHVHVLRAADGLLAERQGHTELGVALANAAEVPPAVVVCEMLDDASGEARSPRDAATYAESHGMPYVEGSAILERLG